MFGTKYDPKGRCTRTLESISSPKVLGNINDESKMSHFGPKDEPAAAQSRTSSKRTLPTCRVRMSIAVYTRGNVCANVHVPDSNRRLDLFSQKKEYIQNLTKDLGHQPILIQFFSIYPGESWQKQAKMRLLMGTPRLFLPK